MNDTDPGARGSRDLLVNRRRLLQMLGYAGAALAVRGTDAAGENDWQFRQPICATRASLCTALTVDYGIRYPIVGAGIAFHALPPLVAALSNAGALGILGGSPEPAPRLALLIRQVKALTGQPFGVDLVHTNLFGAANVPCVTDAHIDVCIEEGVRIVVFFWNTPPAAWVDRLHASGARVWMQVGSVEGAIEAIGAGVDLIIAQGKEAGGHIRGAAREDAAGGAATPLADLLPAVVDAVAPRIVLAAGGIADGNTLMKALALGAEGAWIGTRMMASAEAYCHDEYKRRIVAAAAPADTVITSMFGPEWPGAPIRALRNRVVNEWAGREDQIPIPSPPPPVIGTTIFAGAPYAMPKFSAILPTPDTVGDFEEMCMPAGEASAPLVSDIKPAAEIVADIVHDARTLIAQAVGVHASHA